MRFRAVERGEGWRRARMVFGRAVFGGDILAVIWVLSVFEKRSWDVLNMYEF